MCNRYRIFTDGSAIGNPGPGGWAVVGMQGKRRWEVFGAKPWAAIEEMELLASVEALRPLSSGSVIELRSDSPRNAHTCVSVAKPRVAEL